MRRASILMYKKPSMLPNAKSHLWQTDSATKFNMELTATNLRSAHSTLSILLLTTLISQAVSYKSLPKIDVSQFCEPFPPTSLQRQLCEEYPELLLYLYSNTELPKEFKENCHHEFRNEKWNGENVNFPLYEANTSPFLTLETKEVAFVYALTCATIVDAVAEWCAQNDGRVTYCGCDKTLDDKFKCSPDIDFGIKFTKRLVDASAVNATAQHRTFISHNCEAGQLVVKESMKNTCHCKGNKFNCTRGETCEMELLPMEEVAMKLKVKYERSTCLQQVPSNQTKGELVCFDDSIDYCTPNPDYGINGTAGRDCTVNASHASSSHHCTNLCCDHGIEEYTVTYSQPCECKFVWCCRVECKKTCHKTKTKHRCRTKN